MHAQVPQFLDIEDRIIGPFTLKQFGYIAVGTVVVGGLYLFFQLWVVFVFGLPIAGLVLALAFAPPINGQPLINFLLGFLGFGVKQHIYVWSKPMEEYEIFFKEKALEKEAMKKVEFAQSSIKKSNWSLNLFGRKEVTPSEIILQTEKERAEEVAGTETKIM